MASPNSIHTSSLALSLLRQSSTPSQSFVLSPFSLNIALSNVHDGADGNTQKELTDLLLKDCTPSEVTDFYSSIALSLPESLRPIDTPFTSEFKPEDFKPPSPPVVPKKIFKFASNPPLKDEESASSSDYSKIFEESSRSMRIIKREDEVLFKSANRFYLDDSFSLKNEYRTHVEEKYRVKVEKVKMEPAEGAAKVINEFVEEATNGKIKNVLKAEAIKEDTRAILINAIYLLGKWKYPFAQIRTDKVTFYGCDGERKIDFMAQKGSFRINQNNEFGTVLIMPFKDEKYSFFYLMPIFSSMNIEKTRNELNGDKLMSILNASVESRVEIFVPKFKIESELDGMEVLKKLGVESIFNPTADLSKISSEKIFVNKLQHNAVIEVDEKGTEAAASTVVMTLSGCAGLPPSPPPPIIIDHPFIFGILRNDDIVFIGQFV